jgi:hypothetical protein
MPFRTVHAIVIASDAFTLPLFTALVLLTLKLFENPRARLAWIGLALTLSVGVFCKYTFIGTFPVVTLLVTIAIFRQIEKAARPRWLAIAAMSMAVPSAVFLLEMRESQKVHGSTTSGHWLPKEMDSVMRWSDILTLQQSDRGIFSAPQYFQDKVYDFRKFSYMGLVHLSSFTDCQNFFQTPPVTVSASWRQRVHQGFLRERTPLAQRLEQWSVAWCLPFSALAIAGTIVGGLLSVQSVVAKKKPLLPPVTFILTLLALGFYAPVFLSLHRVGDPYTAGYWLPRLVLPALVVFFMLGFVLVDGVGRRWKESRLVRTISSVFLAYTLGACALFIGFLT